MITVVALDVTALAGQLDYGVIEVVHRKRNKQVNWRPGATIAYCTRAGGSIIDRHGITWSVSCCGLIERDRLLDKTTRDVGMAVLLDGVVYYQRDSDWYCLEPDGKWRPQLQSPLAQPGVPLNLRAGTEYEVAAYATSSKGTGEPCTTIITTATSRPRLVTGHVHIEDNAHV